MLTKRHLAYMDGRRFTLAEARKPSEKKIAETNPFEFTDAGTADADKKHENGRHFAWMAGAVEARADHVAPSKRTVPKRHPRAQARRRFQQESKLLRKGYILTT